MKEGRYTLYVAYWNYTPIDVASMMPQYHTDVISTMCDFIDIWRGNDGFNAGDSYVTDNVAGTKFSVDEWMATHD